MPTYMYRCEKCDAQWDEQRKIADRLIPTTLPCPQCYLSPGSAEAATVVLEPAAPAFGDSYRMGLQKTPAWFGQRLQRIKEKHYGSTINTDRISKTV